MRRDTVAVHVVASGNLLLQHAGGSSFPLGTSLSGAGGVNYLAGGKLGVSRVWPRGLYYLWLSGWSQLYSSLCWSCSFGPFLGASA